MRTETIWPGTPGIVDRRGPQPRRHRHTTTSRVQYASSMIHCVKCYRLPPIPDARGAVGDLDGHAVNTAPRFGAATVVGGSDGPIPHRVEAIATLTLHRRNPGGW